MSKSFVYSLFAITTLATVAHAQEPVAPAAAAEAPKKIQLSAGLFYGLPQGDFKETGGMDVVGSSPGLLLSGGYQVIPKLSVLAQIRYFVMSSEIVGVDLSMWDIELGARYAYPVSPVLSIYGEGFVNRVSYTVDTGMSSDSSGIGFSLGGGVLYALKSNISLGGGLSYSSTSLEPEMGDSTSSGWLSLNAFASYHL